jgi:hypothetical protein
MSPLAKSLELLLYVKSRDPSTFSISLVDHHLQVNTVNLVIKAWDDNSQNVHNITEEILQCL